MARSLLPILAVISLLSLQHAHAATPAVGSVSFANSGAAAAQADFLTGLAQLHNFQYTQAAEAFRRARAIDPDFAMAYWGEAMTHNHAVWMQQDRAAARAVLEKLGATPEARAAKAPTPREKAYLAALETLYGEGDKYERDRRYALAMERLHADYPDDIDATCFYALALLGTSHAGRDVPTYMKAAALMEEIFEQHPRHPGAAHYLIHSVDDSVHAPLGLRAARAYSKIAPDSSHAMHMTSHIFLGLGMWDDVVAANEAAVRLSNPGARIETATGTGCGHATIWLAYGYLQQGRFTDAQRLVETCAAATRDRTEAPTGADALDYDFSAVGALSAMRSRHLIDSGDWSGPVAAIEVRDGVVVAEYLRDFADAYGVVRYGDVADAAAALARAERSAERFTAEAVEVGLPEEAPIRRVPLIQRDELEGLLRVRQGDVDGGLALLAKAAAGEQAIPMEYGPPSLAKPANELLGEVLLELDRPREARAAFEAAQVLAPGRGHSLIGLSECAAALGDRELAASVDARLAKVKLKEALSGRGGAALP
jgi:tetratricopeptide (TPR) repeat protein